MDFEIFIVEKNILNIHYAYILKQFYRNNNDKYKDNVFKTNKIKEDKYDEFKYKNNKIFNLLYFFIIFLLLNPSLSNLKIYLQIEESSIFEPIIYKKYIGDLTNIKINECEQSSNIEYHDDYLKLRCQSNPCNIELSLSEPYGESENELLNGDKMFKDCRALTSIRFSSPKTIYFSSMNSMFHNCESLVFLNLNELNQNYSKICLILVNH